MPCHFQQNIRVQPGLISPKALIIDIESKVTCYSTVDLSQKWVIPPLIAKVFKLFFKMI